MQKNRLLPICRFVSLSRQSFLTTSGDSGFSVAAGVGLGRVFFGRDKGFLGPNRAFELYVATWFSVLRYRKCCNMVFLSCDRFGLAWGFYVAT